MKINLSKDPKNNTVTQAGDATPTPTTPTTKPDKEKKPKEKTPNTGDVNKDGEKKKRGRKPKGKGSEIYKVCCFFYIPLPSSLFLRYSRFSGNSYVMPQTIMEGYFRLYLWSCHPCKTTQTIMM